MKLAKGKVPLPCGEGPSQGGATDRERPNETCAVPPAAASSRTRQLQLVLESSIVAVRCTTGTVVRLTASCLPRHANVTYSSSVERWRCGSDLVLHRVGETEDGAVSIVQAVGLIR